MLCRRNCTASASGFRRRPSQAPQTRASGAGSSYNLPADSDGLPEGVTRAQLPSPTAEGLNDWKRSGYGGPCPPVGRHRYVHKLYALDTLLTGLSKPTKAQVESAMQGHVLAQARLIGTYRKTQ